MDTQHGAGGRPSPICPILNEPFKDPVVASDGHTYERGAIERWFITTNRENFMPRSPMTGLQLESTLLSPNHTLKSFVIEVNALTDNTSNDAHKSNGVTQPVTQLGVVMACMHAACMHVAFSNTDPVSFVKCVQNQLAKMEEHECPITPAQHSLIARAVLTGTQHSSVTKVIDELGETSANMQKDMADRSAIADRLAIATACVAFCKNEHKDILRKLARMSESLGILTREIDGTLLAQAVAIELAIESGGMVTAEVVAALQCELDERVRCVFGQDSHRDYAQTARSVIRLLRGERRAAHFLTRTLRLLESFTKEEQTIAGLSPACNGNKRKRHDQAEPIGSSDQITLTRDQAAAAVVDACKHMFGVCGYPTNSDKAVALLTVAREAGNVCAIAWCISKGHSGYARDTKKAVALLTADDSDIQVVSQLVLGAHYADMGGRRNHVTAMHHFMRASEMHTEFDAAAIYLAAVSAVRSESTTNTGDNHPFELMTRSANMGCSNAQLDIGRMYLKRGGDSTQKGMEFMHAAAENGNIEATYAIGLYHGGIVDAAPADASADHEREQAFNWLSKASDGGHTSSDLSHALLVHRSQMIRSHSPRTIRLYTKSANRGCATSQRMLGLYNRRIGRPDMARHWFECAAIQSDAVSQYMLGMTIRSESEPSALNLIHTAELYLAAASQGHTPAIEAFVKLIET
jgi:TPR repeat protein